MARLAEAGWRALMHVGLNLVYLQPDSGGLGTYARELLRALKAVDPSLRFTAWVSRDAPRDLLLEHPDVTWVRLPVRAAGSPVHVAVELLLLGVDARRRGVDVVHGPAYATPVLAPGVATVVTIPDITWLLHPATVTTRARYMFRLLARWCGRSADRVIVLSQHARDGVVGHLRIDAAKLVVTPLSASLPAPTPALEVTPSSAEIRQSIGVPDGARVLLCVGQLALHKNLHRLVDAVASLDDVVLVLAGRHAHGAEQVLDRARARSVHVIAPGWVADVRPLYCIADVFVLPSVSEGFGLPVLEAMAAGVPVACANAGSLPEVAGDAALLFNPLSTEDIAAACRGLLGDAAARAALVTRGRRRATEFSWDSCARGTLATYRAAVEHHQHRSLRARARRWRASRRPPRAT